MLGFLVLMAMVPAGGDLRSGEPAPQLGNEAATQWRLSARDPWRAFQARWGGRWAARWDPRTGLPRFLYAPGIPQGQASELVAEVAGLAGVDPADLSAGPPTRSGDRVIVVWSRSWHGAPVLGQEIVTVAQAGRIAGVWVRITPIHLRQEPAPGEVVLTWAEDARGEPRDRWPNRPRVALAREIQEGPIRSYVDRLGRTLLSWDERLYGEVILTHEERSPGDDLIESPGDSITVTDGSGTTEVTDDAGVFSLTGALSLSYEGPDLVVTDNGSAPEVSGTDDITSEGGQDVSLAVNSTWHHVGVVWDWLSLRRPDHAWLGSQVPATVNLSGLYCNAYYSSGTVNFGLPSSSCTNTGQNADVIYHEVGHGIHQYVLASGTFASDISEGSSDFVSATITGDSQIGPYFYTNGGPVREIATDKVYPTDVSGEPHNDGLIWASFLWDLREQWVASYGETDGVAMTDALFLEALSHGPTLTDAYEAVILADDDNGDLTDGVPHACELVDLLDEHGLGPGSIGVVIFDHEPLGPQASATEAYEVAFTLTALTPECGDLDEDSVQLWFTTEELGAPGTEEGGEDFTGWTSVSLSHEADGSWLGTIPRQLATTQVRYFMTASSTDGTETVRTHGGHDAQVYSFYVGDREEIWCEGFEEGALSWENGGGTPWAASGGQSQWEAGAPAGTTFSPDAAYAGAGVVATNLEGDYLPNNAQYTRSPTVSLPEDGRMQLLTFQRWLSVEDGIYDHARLYVGETEAWANPASADAGDPVLDTAWTLQEEALASHVDPGGEIDFSWTLDSDSGLEFGGWALDEICVVQLADLPGHYRVRDLDASDDLDQVEIRWTQPWIAPLTTTVLVRKADSWPESPEDGLIVDLDLAPEPGASREVTDPEAGPGDSYYYALFAQAEEGGEWTTEVIEGENADLGGVPADPEPEDTAVVDTGPAEEEPEDTGASVTRLSPTIQVQLAKGCGCASVGAPAGIWLLLSGLLALSRRRR